MKSWPAALVVCALAAILAGWSSLGNGFTYDDPSIVSENPRVTDPARMGEIWTSTWWPDRAHGGLYRPLTVFTYALNHRAGGLNPSGYHLVNLLLHALVTVLVCVAARALVGPAGAVAAGLLFAVHPVHTEAVANLVGRAEILAALGFLVAWLAHPPGGKAPQAGGPAGAVRGGGWRAVAAAAAYGAGVLSKEVAIVLPVALLFRDRLARRRPHLPAYALYAVVAGLYLAARYRVLGALGNPKELVLFRLDNVIATLPPLAAAWTAISVIGRYLVLLVVPWRLSADYSYPQIAAAGPADLWAWVGLAGGAALLALAVRPLVVPTTPRWRAAAAGAGVFLITLFPVSNLAVRIGTVMAERLLYLPSVGFLVMVAALAEPLYGAAAPAGRRRAMGTVFLAVCLLFGVRSFERSRDWKDDLTLHARTVETSPRSARARYNHGVALHDAGQVAAGVAELEQAVRLDPTYSEAWTNLGGYKIALGRNADARRDLDRAIAGDSTWWTAYVSLAGLDIMEHRPAAAVPLLRKAIAGAPGNPEAWYNLELAEVALGDTAGAIGTLRDAVGRGIQDADIFNDLAWYVACTAGPTPEAYAMVRKALALRSDGSIYDTLAEIERRAGRYAEAREAWTRALAAGVPDPDGVRRKLAALPPR